PASRIVLPGGHHETHHAETTESAGFRTRLRTLAWRIAVTTSGGTYDMKAKDFVKWSLLSAVAATLIVGCGKKDDAITQAEKKDVAKGISAPGIAETKAIAEEGFIYGLPIVMNYAAMYEIAVDHSSSQFKAPFNEIKNETRVFTYKDTAVVTPNSDTPYSV